MFGDSTRRPCVVKPLINTQKIDPISRSRNLEQFSILSILGDVEYNFRLILYKEAIKMKRIYILLVSKLTN